MKTMERAFEITKIEEVFLYCDKCGTEMYKDNDAKNFDVVPLNGKPDVQFLGYLYRCPKCGVKHRSQNNYPYQRLHCNKPTSIDFENNSSGEHP